MTAKVAANYAASRVQSAFKSPEAAAERLASAHTRSGEVIARTLGDLKGAVMKVGQMASIAQDVLPREVSNALSALQREAPPMPFETIASQIEREFSQPPETLFAEIDPRPFASASIGQVHRAVTDDGREVVVKVQYPGVEEAVDSDLAHLKIALRASGLIKIDRASLARVFAEIRDRLHEELDYCLEADNVRRFRDYYRDDPRILVPDVVGERSSQRVLTLTYLAGDPLSEAVLYPQEVRNEIGLRLFGMVADQVFRFGIIHADPNPANFAFRPDGTLVLYDFGCVKKLSPEIVAAYRDTIAAALRADYEAVDEGLFRLGARNPKGQPVPPEYYAAWRDILGRPFLTPGPYDFTGSASVVQRDALKMIPGFLAKYSSSFQPPAELVFLDRVVLGHFGTLGRLGARCELLPRLMPYLTPGPGPRTTTPVP